MTQQHLHSKIGDVIKEEKRRLFNRLKSGDDLAVSTSEFVAALAKRLTAIVKNLNSESVPN